MLVKSDIIGAERLEERSLSALFAYQLQDRFRITAILGAHLLALGIGAALLFAKAVYLGGLYDTWACWRLLAYSNKSSYNDNKSFYMVSTPLC